MEKGRAFERASKYTKDHKTNSDANIELRLETETVSGCEINMWGKKMDMRSVSLKDKLRNSVIRKQCGLKEHVVNKIGKGMLRLFGHIEKMDDKRQTKDVTNRWELIEDVLKEN